MTINGTSQWAIKRRMKEAGAFSCGHEWSMQNQVRNGNSYRCRQCAEEQKARREKIKNERDDKIRAYVRSGKTIKEASKEFGVSYNIAVKACGGLGTLRRSELIKDPLFSSRALKVAAEAVGANPEQLRKNWREKPLVRARWAFMIAMRKRGASTKRIGNVLHRDHTTVIYALRKALPLVAQDPYFSDLVRRVDAA